MFVTLRDISQGLVTAPRSHAVIIMDLTGNWTKKIISFNICNAMRQRRHVLCRALPAHVSVTLHIPVVFPFADQLKEGVSVPGGKHNNCTVYAGVNNRKSTRGRYYLKEAYTPTVNSVQR